MKWGKTNKQVDKDREPRVWFAWHPVHLVDGRWAWLEHVEREYAANAGGWKSAGWIYKGLIG